ncbi:Transmembrane 9 superfamily member 2 [Sorochytrium milnesiophthora]
MKSRTSPLAALLLLLVWLAASSCHAFYLPGVAPVNYNEGDQVELVVNALTSPASAVPYDYYDDRLHFCKPENGPERKPESLGSILYGDRLYTSPFKINMLKSASCNVLCAPQTVPKADVKFIKNRISESAAVNWLVDGLPAAAPQLDLLTNQTFYRMGFNLGETTRDGKVLLYNHYDIRIDYHAETDGDKAFYRVVGVVVWPYSRRNAPDVRKQVHCDPKDTPVVLDENQDAQVTYTYSVEWAQSDVNWATRWDKYLHVVDANVHWFSIVNAIIIVLVLSGMVGVTTIRALRRDITRYNAVDAQEDAQEDFGWKLVHGDVFRPPAHPMMLSVLVGTGVQLLVMTLVTLAFAVLGVLNPANRGSLMTAMIIIWAALGSLAGYNSARLYKTFGGEHWKKNVFLTAFLFPGVIFGIFLFLNFFLIGERSSGAVPFTVLLSLMATWFLLSVPLSICGSFYGFKKARIEASVRTNQIPRQIPPQPFYGRMVPSILMGGILPFAAVFAELYFIMNSIWFHRIYYVFGFLFIVYGVLVLACAQVTVLITYFQLCAEDYRWWWRSFLTSGASAFYVFLYSIYYYAFHLHMTSFVSTLLFFGWTTIMCLIFFVLTGAIGFVASWVFVRQIYSCIKID